MKQKALSMHTKIMSLVISTVLLAFLAIGAANAALPEKKSGSWVQKQYEIKGGWTIEQRGDSQVITFNNKFKTKKGPDLKVFLSKQSISDVTGKTAVNDAVLVSALKNNNGEQEYVLPAGVDANDFKSLLIHCESYSVLWGGADL